MHDAYLSLSLSSLITTHLNRLTADDIEAMLAECVESNAKSLDSELLDGHSEAWEATNFENGQWTQGVCLM